MLFKKHHSDIWETLFSLMMIRFVILAMMLVLLAPRQETQPPGDHDRGNIRIEINWPTGKDVDVDLWVKAPGDNPVGWSNKNGKVFDLVRDDLGSLNNPSGIHYELAYARSTPPGEYIVNIHLYANRSDLKIVPVDATVSVTKEDTGKSTQEKIATRHLELVSVGEELTVIRFTVDSSKNIVPNSINSVYQPIYKR